MKKIVLFGLLSAALQCLAGDIDRSAVDFIVAKDIKWEKVPGGLAERAVLFGDPNKPGPYVMRLKWLPGGMSRPQCPGRQLVKRLAGYTARNKVFP